MSFDEWRVVLVGALTAVTTYSLVGIVAVWAATGRGHWFWKTSVVLLLSASWLLVGDDGLCLMFLTQSALIMLWLWTFRDRRANQGTAILAESPQASPKPDRPSFSLGELGLAFILISGVLAMLARVRTSTYAWWYTSVVPGAVLGMFTLASAAAVRNIRNPWFRLAAIVADFPALLVGAWLWLARSARARGARVGAVLMLLLIAWLPVAYFVREFAWHAIAFPSPLADNSYSDLLQASRSIKSPPPSIDKLSDAALRKYVARNRSALDRAVEALDRPCQAVLPDDVNDNLLVAEMHELEQLAGLLAARSRARLADGSASAAATDALAAIRVGASIAQGGVMAHDMFGGVIEQTGVDELQKTILQLDDDNCRQLAEQLMAIDVQREPLETIMQRERRYLKQAYAWKHRVWALVPAAPQSLEALWEAAFNLKCARLRLLACHLALRRHYLATESYPATLDKLIPQYLTEVPPDPFSDQALVYRKLPQGYQLYSVGFDGVDDGGKAAPPFTTTIMPKGDIVVDPAPAAVITPDTKQGGNVSAMMTLARRAPSSTAAAFSLPLDRTRKSYARRWPSVLAFGKRQMCRCLRANNACRR